jgi:hypothetical protein
MKAMTSSITETQECLLMKEVYDHIYFESEKNRIEKELLEKENKESGSTNLSKNGMKFLR